MLGLLFKVEFIVYKKNISFNVIEKYIFKYNTI